MNEAGIFLAIFLLMGLAGLAVDWLSKRLENGPLMAIAGALLVIIMVGSLVVGLTSAPKPSDPDRECIGPPSESC